MQCFTDCRISGTLRITYYSDKYNFNTYKTTSLCRLYKIMLIRIILIVLTYRVTLFYSRQIIQIRVVLKRYMLKICKLKVTRNYYYLILDRMSPY